jgi:hypothetical protein
MYLLIHDSFLGVVCCAVLCCAVPCCAVRDYVTRSQTHFLFGFPGFAVAIIIGIVEPCVVVACAHACWENARFCGNPCGLLLSFSLARTGGGETCVSRRLFPVRTLLKAPPPNPPPKTGQEGNRRQQKNKTTQTPPCQRCDETLAQPFNYVYPVDPVDPHPNTDCLRTYSPVLLVAWSNFPWLGGLAGA